MKVALAVCIGGVFGCILEFVAVFFDIVLVHYLTIVSVHENL